MTRSSAPTFCFVTDRHRIDPDARTLAAELLALETRVAMAVEAGVHLVQLRERDLDGRQLVRLARRLTRLTRGSGTRLLVNDRVDVAAVAGTAGVHLRADGPPPARVRTLLPPGAIISQAVHDGDDVSARASGVDVLVYGTVQRTASKPDSWPTAGFGGLAGAVTAAGATPVLAIGGIGWADMRRVAQSGAAGVAGIGLFLGAAVADAGSLGRALDTAREAWSSRP